MLVEFSVSNFLTIRNRATLSMVAEKLHGDEALASATFTPSQYKDIPLLRAAAVYGANASGKTNFLKSITVFRNFVLESTHIDIGESLPFEPFGLAAEAREEPTTFEIEFVAADQVRYIYGFSYNAEEILSEHLYSFANNNRRVELFVRKKGSPIKFGSSFKGSKKTLEEQLQCNHLLLTKAAQSNFVQVHPAYRWCASLPVQFSRWNDNEFTKQQAYQNPEFLEKVSQFLRIADTGIEAVQIYSKSVERMFGGFSQASDEATMLEARVVHRAIGNSDSKPIVWSMENESAGTRRLFSLTGPILDALAKGKVLFVDELDNHLHSLLSEMVVGLFNNAETNPLNAQLIFTTHDTSLLKKENFRRDQIWFIEKDHDGASRLFPLSAFDKKTVRWDIPFDRWYLSGRFGATPLIRDYDITAR